MDHQVHIVTLQHSAGSESSNAGLYEFPPASGKEIHLPHLRKFLATSEEDEDDMKRSLGFLHHLSLPASVSILWGSRSEGDLMVRFPPTEHLKLVQSIVISLDQADYLDCTCLIEGGTLFTSPAKFSRLRYPILVDKLSGQLAHADPQ